MPELDSHHFLIFFPTPTHATHTTITTTLDSRVFIVQSSEMRGMSEFWINITFLLIVVFKTLEIVYEKTFIY